MKQKYFLLFLIAIQGSFLFAWETIVDYAYNDFSNHDFNFHYSSSDFLFQYSGNYSGDGEIKTNAGLNSPFLLTGRITLHGLLKEMENKGVSSINSPVLSNNTDIKLSSNLSDNYLKGFVIKLLPIRLYFLEQNGGYTQLGLFSSPCLFSQVTWEPLFNVTIPAACSNINEAAEAPGLNTWDDKSAPRYHIGSRLEFDFKFMQLQISTILFSDIIKSWGMLAHLRCAFYSSIFKPVVLLEYSDSNYINPEGQLSDPFFSAIMNCKFEINNFFQAEAGYKYIINHKRIEDGDYYPGCENIFANAGFQLECGGSFILSTSLKYSIDSEFETTGQITQKQFIEGLIGWEKAKSSIIADIQWKEISLTGAAVETFKSSITFSHKILMGNVYLSSIDLESKLTYSYNRDEQTSDGSLAAVFNYKNKSLRINLHSKSPVVIKDGISALIIESPLKYLSFHIEWKEKMKHL